MWEHVDVKDAFMMFHVNVCAFAHWDVVRYSSTYSLKVWSLSSSELSTPQKEGYAKKEQEKELF